MVDSLTWTLNAEVTRAIKVDLNHNVKNRRCITHNVSVKENRFSERRFRFVIYSRRPVDSMRDAMFTVSPNRQYLGILIPTTPAAQGPLHM